MTLSDLKQAYGGLKHRTRVSIVVLAVAAVTGGLLGALGEHLRDSWGAEAARLQQELTGVEAQTSMLHRDIAFVEENTGHYEAVLARGLFGDRNRLLARRALERQLVANRLQGSITLHPRVRGEQTHRIGDQQYVMLTAPVEIAANGMLDRDLFSLFGDVGSAVPGYLVFHEADLTREAATPEVLADLRNGLPVPLVTGRLAYQWRSAGPAENGEATQ